MDDIDDFYYNLRPVIEILKRPITLAVIAFVLIVLVDFSHIQSLVNLDLLKYSFKELPNEFIASVSAFIAGKNYFNPITFTTDISTLSTDIAYFYGEIFSLFVVAFLLSFANEFRDSSTIKHKLKFSAYFSLIYLFITVINYYIFYSPKIDTFGDVSGLPPYNPYLIFKAQRGVPQSWFYCTIISQGIFRFISSMVLISCVEGFFLFMRKVPALFDDFVTKMAKGLTVLIELSKWLISKIQELIKDSGK